MKSQVLFSSKDKRKKLKCRLLHFLFGALEVKNPVQHLNITLKDTLCFLPFCLLGLKASLASLYGLSCS